MSTICVFGDSIVWGATDPEGGGWVTRLRNYFESQGLRADRDVDVYNLGVSGDNTDDLVKRFDVEMAARQPDIVVFAIGINDSQYVISKSGNRVPLERFSSNLESMVGRAAGSGAHVILVGLTRVDEAKTSPIPWNTDKRYSNTDIEMYDAAIRAIAQKEGIRYVDMSKAFPASDLADGLHPNTRGHAKMYAIMKKSVLPALETARD